MGHTKMLVLTPASYHSVKRIRDYESCNIKLGDQLIITEETSTIPLCPQDIENVIKHYLE